MSLLLSTRVGLSLVNVKPDTRHLWSWLNNIFNRVDLSRIEAVGPDVACAEWLLRCGAQVKWKNSERWYADYNSLPKDGNRRLAEIDATGSAVMSVGFPHLKNLKHLEKIRLHKCNYLNDEALVQLPLVVDTLAELQVSSCGDVSDEGIVSLHQLVNLKLLRIYDLDGVKDFGGCLDLLKKSLPKCTVVSKPEEEKE